MTYDDFKSLCERRRSTRSFDQKLVSREDLLLLLDLARLSPSVQNLQPWHFHIIFNKDLRHTLTEMSYYGNFVEGAGAFIVVTADRSLINKAKKTLWNEKELEYSCVAAMTNIILGAASMDIDSCLVSLARGDVHELLNLPHSEIVVGGIMLGYHKRGEDEGNDNRERHPLEGMCTFHE